MTHPLLATLPGRAILAGVAFKLVIAIVGWAIGGRPAFLTTLDTLASIVIAAAGLYMLARSVSAVTGHLLWRIRRKLIISYIFIGLVPALLIVAFFLLADLLLFSYFSSYLVQSGLQAVTDRASVIATTTALELQRGAGRDLAAIVEDRATAAQREFPNASIVVVAMERGCADTGNPAAASDGRVLHSSGPWSHVARPGAVPPWISCVGFEGLLAYTRDPRVAADPRLAIDNDRLEVVELVARAVALPDVPRPAFAVIVDLPIDRTMQNRLRDDTGVTLTDFRLIRGEHRLLTGHSGAAAAGSPAVPAGGLEFESASVLQYSDWTSGGRGGSLLVEMQLSIQDVYSKISAAQGLIRGQSFGYGLLIGLVFIGGLFLVIAAIALGMGLALARSISGSVHELFVGTERVREGDFTHKIDVVARDQLGELAVSFNSMTDSIEDLLQQAAEKKRLEEELRIAHEIQMSLLPQGPLRLPGVSVTALCVPAREVGGDYYDFLPIDEHRVGILIADVSGKGTSAALYMAELKGLVLSLSRIYTSPRELLIAANQILAEHLDQRSFITMTYAVLDARAHTLTYARAGHTPLIYFPSRATGDAAARILTPDGLVLGLKLDRGELFERLLQEDTIALNPQDVLLLFTDGITEAMNAGADCFGEDRLAALVEEHAHLPPEELRERVLREIEAFVGDVPQHDDMTMILIKVDEVAAGAAVRVGAEPVAVERA